MFKVKVDFTDNDKDVEDYSFETEMPVLPNIGSMLGFWVRGQWFLAEVSGIVYEFDEAGKYLLAEVSVHS
jgi:hypothetical protein